MRLSPSHRSVRSCMLQSIRRTRGSLANTVIHGETEVGIDALMYASTTVPIGRQDLCTISYHLMVRWHHALYAGPRRFIQGVEVSGAVPALRLVADDPVAKEQGFDPVKNLMHIIPDGYRDPGLTWMRVALSGHFYAEDYCEVGDPMDSVAIAAWLESVLPGDVEVFYGGDDGHELEGFDAARRYELAHHYWEQQVPFTEGAVVCSLCEYPMDEVRLKPGVSPPDHARWGAVRCAGCRDVVRLPGSLTEARSASEFRSRLQQVIPWIAGREERGRQLLDVLIREIPRDRWQEVQSGDLIPLLQSPEIGIRTSAARLASLLPEARGRRR